MFEIGFASVAPAVGRDLGHSFFGLAFIAQSRKFEGTMGCSPKSREDQMPSLVDDAWDWLDRAEQAREVAGQLTDPVARTAVIELAESFVRLVRAAITPAVLRRPELTKHG
jgi:hypothetical protein